MRNRPPSDEEFYSDPRFLRMEELALEKMLEEAGKLGALCGAVGMFPNDPRLSRLNELYLEQRVKVLAEMHSHVERELYRLVGMMRARGASWQDVAQAVSMSPRAAQQRYGD